MKTKHTSNLILVFLVLGLLVGSLLLSACNPVSEVQAQPFPTKPSTEAVLDVIVDEATPEPTLQTYTNPDYRLSFTYTPDWSLTESTAGNEFPASVVVELAKDSYLVKIHIKFHWDRTVIGGGIGPGQTGQDGSIMLLGQAANRNRLVLDGKTKLVWYSGTFNDLELYIRIEDASQGIYDGIEIPQALIAEVESILASLTRTGEPLTPPPAPQPTALPTFQPEEVTCNLSPRLNVDGWAQVTPGLPNAMRSAPGRGADSVVVGEIPAGTTVRILEGPVCASGYYWWRVDAGLVSGWTPEGGNGIYWLTPVAGESSISVDGWVGVIVANPTGTQFDDYFQMLDQNGTRYGIDSLDPNVQQQMIDLRDTGQMIRVWGTLTFDVPDAYGRQVSVTRLENMP